tara:strand:+ start:734 stop:2938 length:2205 start_codon:yes stop_codon:yes gene_type:complete
MANDFTYNPDDVVDWTEGLEKIYARQTAQLNRYHEQARQVDQQRYNRDVQQAKLADAVVKTVGLTKRVGNWLDEQKEKKITKEYKELGVMPQHWQWMKEVENERTDGNNFSKELTRQKYTAKGMPAEVADYLLSLSGKEIIYAEKRLARQLALTQPAAWKQNAKYQEEFNQADDPNVQLQLLKYHRDEYFSKFHDGFSDDLVQDIIHKDFDDWSKTIIGAKESKAQREINGKRAQTARNDLNLALMTSQPNAVVNHFNQVYTDTVASIPENHPYYNRKEHYAKELMAGQITAAILNEEMNETQAGELWDAEWFHPGFVTKDNPKGRTTFGEMMKGSENIDLPTLLGDAAKLSKKRLDAADLVLENQGRSKVQAGLQQIRKEFKANEQQLGFEAAKLKAQEATAALTSSLRGYTNEKLKNFQDYIANPKTIEDQTDIVTAKAINGTLTESYLNSIKEEHPDLYAKFQPIQSILKDIKTRSSSYVGAINTQTGYTAEAQASKSDPAAGVKSWLEQQVRTAVVNEMLALTPEQAQDGNTRNKILSTASSVVIDDFVTQGGARGDSPGAQIDDEGKEHLLFAYDPTTNTYPNFESEILGITKESKKTRTQIRNNTRRIARENPKVNGVPSWKQEGPTPDSGKYLKRSEVESALNSGTFTQNMIDQSNVLGITTHEFVTSQAAVMKPPIKIDQKQLEPVQKLFSGLSPSMTCIVNHKEGNLSPNFIKRCVQRMAKNQTN